MCLCVVQVSEEAGEVEQNKYQVKPPRDLGSQFEKRLEAKEAKGIEDEKKKRIAEEEARIAVSNNNLWPNAHSLSTP